METLANTLLYLLHPELGKLHVSLVMGAWIIMDLGSYRVGLPLLKAAEPPKESLTGTESLTGRQHYNCY